MTKRKIQYWMIPPETDGEFIACMEEVLDTYAEEYDADYPVLCMDEQPVQLHKEIRKPIPATKKHPRRVDYEYERCGTASLFMFTEPHLGWRQVEIRERRTKIDWALEMEALLNTRYKKAKKVILVGDNLNTHTKGAFYEAFPPAKARALVKTTRLSLHAQAWQLAEHRRKRVEHHDTPVRFGTPHCDHQANERRDKGLVRSFKPKTKRRRLAVQNQRRQNKTEVTLPQN